MTATVVKVFVSSTWLDLKPERAALEDLLQRLHETRFVGMEHFGGRDESTRRGSLDEVDGSDLYIGVIGDRFGSGITAAEYRRARRRRLTCLIYFKQGKPVKPDATPPDGTRDADRADAAQLARFKARLHKAHTVVTFSGAHELASRVASDLHNWLFERYLAPALRDAARRPMAPDRGAALAADLQHLAQMNRELLAQVAEEKRRVVEQREAALAAFYQLTYDVPAALAKFPSTAALREHVVRLNLKQIGTLLAADPQDAEVLRELATNHRLLGTILIERGQQRRAIAAFRHSAARCATLVALQPGCALYQRDLAVSHLNAGSLLEGIGDADAARREYEAAWPAARAAARLDAAEFASLPADLRGRLKRLRAR